MMKSKQHGGAGRGQGRKSAEAAGIEKKGKFLLSAHPSVVLKFKEIHGRAWCQRVEELIIQDMKSGE